MKSSRRVSERQVNAVNSGVLEPLRDQTTNEGSRKGHETSVTSANDPSAHDNFGAIVRGKRLNSERPSREDNVEQTNDPKCTERHDGLENC